MRSIPIYVGFDRSEPVIYHTFSQSVIERSSMPLALHPLALRNLYAYMESHRDGSNEFVYSRFLVPYMQGFHDWAIFCDGDMVCRSDIAKLWALRNENYAVMVVKHDYRTKYPIKYRGSKNEDYPRKNWSSVILWNCAHAANAKLDPTFIEDAKGSYLHRFAWLTDDMIGELPIEWNWLAGEYADQAANPKLIHYTVGAPCFDHYRDFDLSEAWHQAHRNMNHADQ